MIMYIVYQVMLGLEYLHGTAQVVWHDLKLRNFMWTHKGTLKLIDFNHSESFTGRPAEDLARAKKADYDSLASQIWLLAVRAGAADVVQIRADAYSRLARATSRM